MRNEVTVWLAAVQVLMLKGVKLFLECGRLVDEAFAGDYHKDLGFDNMEKYIDDAYNRNKFPCQHREALERLKVWRGAKELKVSMAKLTALSAIQLKDIFSLDVKVHGDAIRALIDEAVTLDMNATKIRVKAIKTGKSVAEINQAAEDAKAAPKTETANAKESADLFKFNFTFTKANGAIVERALALFGTDKKDALLKMATEALAIHAAVAPTVPAEPKIEEAKVLAAGA